MPCTKFYAAAAMWSFASITVATLSVVSCSTLRPTAEDPTIINGRIVVLSAIAL